MVWNQYQSFTTLGQYQAAHPELRSYTMPCKVACFYPQNSSKISLHLNNGSLNRCVFFVNLLYLFRFLQRMHSWIIIILSMVRKFTNITGIYLRKPISTWSNFCFSLDSETRSLRETFNPMCEVINSQLYIFQHYFSFIFWESIVLTKWYHKFNSRYHIHGIYL